ncbi:hypothetical protein ACGGZK_06815 [Agromyces sp. MMS24-K17]|uniref:hypothetical protein n=1 Tax=Agromyces sp. MMS24-K17 TaxID=3372850 RepID=UPI003754E802
MITPEPPPDIEWINYDETEAPLDEVLRMGGRRTAFRKAGDISIVTVLEISAFDPDPVYEVRSHAFREPTAGDRRTVSHSASTHDDVHAVLDAVRAAHFAEPET